MATHYVGQPALAIKALTWMQNKFNMPLQFYNIHSWGTAAENLFKLTVSFTGQFSENENMY